MSRIVLIHWHDQEAEDRRLQLTAAGHHAEIFRRGGGEGLRRFRENPPDAFVIDLSRLPSHGREVGIFLRQQKTTRHVPLLFVEGAPEKTAKVRGVLPDATYTSWAGLRTALSRALKPHAPPKRLVVPDTMAAYSGTPLLKKLGIKAVSRVILLGAPEGFESLMDENGGAMRIRRTARARGDVILLFVKSQTEFDRRFAAARACMDQGARMWIAWPKKASGVATDVSESFIRTSGLDRGLVDFKICSIDQTWSGLCFAVRK